MEFLSVAYIVNRSIGYNEVTATTTKASFHAMSGVKMGMMDGLDDHEPCTQRLLPRPDISQMIPFKPKRDPYPGEHPVPGESIFNLLNKNNFIQYS